jgi:ABC-type dipeptide/oligopeptide/nickel transport system permease component
MAQFIVLRLLHTILILFGVSIVAFGLIHLIPGNPLDILLPPEAPKEVVERLKVEFGFDKPLYVHTWLGWVGVLQGNLGTSVFTGLRVTGELLSALGNTFVLAIPAALPRHRSWSRQRLILPWSSGKQAARKLLNGCCRTPTSPGSPSVWRRCG